MSHIVTLNLKYTDVQALETACQKRNISYQKHKHKCQIYSNNVDAIFSFKLPGWTFPVAVMEDGEVKYDNYNGHWGDQSKLDSFSQEYGKQIGIQELAKENMFLSSEEQTEDGTMILTFEG